MLPFLCVDQGLDGNVDNDIVGVYNGNQRIQ